MAYIQPDTLHEIQTSTSIVDYIGQYVQLKKAGKDDYEGLCPFHNEKTPSFHVNESKHVFHCFGCGKSGNIFQFAEYYHHLTFPEAVHQVAEFAHLDVGLAPKQQAKETPQLKERRALMHLHQRASEMYQHILWNTDAGQVALDYLHQRGLTDEDIRTFEIGFVPNTEKVDILVNVLQDDLASEQEYEASGLFKMDRSGRPHDRFSNRVMFPLKNRDGKVVAFSGRAMPDAGRDVPKYLNSPETLIFNKRKLLFNFDKAYQAARQDGYFVLFEGYMDVIAAHRAGVASGVASMGTSLTEEQIQQLKSISPHIVICYDGDRAGIEATARAIQFMRDEKVPQISVVSLPDGLDPDEFIKQNGTEAFVKQVTQGQLTAVQFMLSYLKRDRNLQNEQDKLHYVEQALTEIAPLDSFIERDMYLRQLAEETQLSVDSLQNQLLTVKAQTQRQQRTVDNTYLEAPPVVEFVPPEEVVIKEQTPLESVEQRLLYRAMNEKAVRDYLNQCDFAFPDASYEELYLVLSSYLQMYDTVEAADFFNVLKKEEHRQIFGEIIKLNMSKQSTQREIDDYLTYIQQTQWRSELKDCQQEMREAGRMGNRQLERELSQKMMQLLLKLKQK